MIESNQGVKHLYHYTRGAHGIELEMYEVKHVTEGGNYRLVSGELVYHDSDDVDPKLDDFFPWRRMVDTAG